MIANESSIASTSDSSSSSSCSLLSAMPITPCDVVVQGHDAITRDLLDELEKAHLIIRHALAVMRITQKITLGKMNEAAGCDGEGITRANEREAVIRQAKWRAK